MAAKKPIVLRVGQNIYEDIIIEKYNPIITNAYDIKFIATIIYTYSAAQKTIANRQTKSLLGKCIDKTVKNWASKSEYLGSYPVEKVTKNDSVIISQIKKIIGKDTIIIDGEEV